ncbi:sulfatase [Verrucomicrobiota bacterium]
MTIRRREFLKIFGATAATISSAFGAAAGRTGKPNVLVVHADQWRYHAMGCADNADKNVRTPNLDKMAQEGVNWSRSYAVSPVCTPNRAVFMTSRYPHQTGMFHNDLQLPPTEKNCIADTFSSAGYKTCYIGKWHLDGPPKSGYVPKGWRRHGFQTFVGFNRGHSYDSSPTFDDDGTKASGYKRKWEPTAQVNTAIDFMKQNKARPWFVFLSWGPPHGPYKSQPGFEYTSKDIVPRPNVGNGEDINKLVPYFSMCSALDHEFGRLMNALKSMGVSKNTIVLFTADHGDMHGSHGKRHKNFPEEESAHIPCLMRFPSRVKDGQKISVPISTVDYMPTLLGLCGITVPGTCAGIDKSDLMLGGKQDSETSIYLVQNHKGTHWRAVVKGRYKYFVHSNDSDEKDPHLFDLDADPYELKNLVSDTKSKSVLSDMRKEYEGWQSRLKDVFPKKSPNLAKPSYTA